MGWCRYVGSAGDVISIERFGASAPGKTVLEKFGYTVENVVARANALMGKADTSVHTDKLGLLKGARIIRAPFLMTTRLWRSLKQLGCCTRICGRPRMQRAG